MAGKKNRKEEKELRAWARERRKVLELRRYLNPRGPEEDLIQLYAELESRSKKEKK